MAMNPGMKMLALAKTTQGGRMGNDHSTRMGGYNREMNDSPEMRRRRDDKGRYMEGDSGADMAYRPWPEPHMPPYLDRPESRRMNDDRQMTDKPYQMRDRNIVNIRDYQDRRQNIGFRQMDDEEEPEMRQYGRRYAPDRMAMKDGYRQQENHMGHGQGAGDRLTREEAEEWVEGMHGADGSKGGRWKLNEIKQYAGNFGIQGEEKIVEFFAVMNAMYTDYCKVAKKFGVDKVEFYADLAKAFMDDKDAMPGKVKTYFECIAKKDDE